MARPTKQGMDYFPHDTDACSDEKVDALRILYGNDGYAFYFILLERIYRTPDFELDVSDAETIQILCKKVEVTPEKFAEMLKTALKRRCFCPDAYEKRKVLTSPGIKKRSAGVVNKRQKMASAYQNRVSDAETPPETGEETTQSKVKESKVKKEYADSGESSSAKPEEPKPVKPTRITYTPEFEAFWKASAKPSASKLKAFEVWRRLSAVEQGIAVEKVPAYVRFQPDPRYRKDPERWLRDRLFESEFVAAPINSGVGGTTIPPLGFRSQFKTATPD